MRKGFEILKFVELLYRNQRWVLLFFCTKLDGPMTEQSVNILSQP